MLRYHSSNFADSESQNPKQPQLLVLRLEFDRNKNSYLAFINLNPALKVLSCIIKILTLYNASTIACIEKQMPKLGIRNNNRQI